MLPFFLPRLSLVGVSLQSFCLPREAMTGCRLCQTGYFTGCRDALVWVEAELVEPESALEYGSFRDSSRRYDVSCGVPL